MHVFTNYEIKVLKFRRTQAQAGMRNYKREVNIYRSVGYNGLKH